MKRHSESCSCTNCAYKIRSKRPSFQQVLADGTRIDKLFYGKYLPLRERKLLEKLVRTRAVYDNVKDRLLSASGSSDLTKSDYTGKSQGYHSNRKKKMIEVTDRGEIRSSNTSKLSSCCNCCSCSSLKKIKKSIEKHPHVHKHYVPYENIAKYNRNAEIRAKARRRRLGSNINEKMRDIRYKSKNVRSDPCFCTLSLMKFSSKRSIKRLRLKKGAKRGIGPSISFAESEVEHRSKAGQKLRSIRQSIVNSIESRFKIKKDSLSLFRAKLRKRGMRRRRRDLETYGPEFRPRRRRRGKKSHHTLSTIYVKSVTSSTSKPKFKTSAVKMKSKRKMRKRHKRNKEMKTLNRESQVSVPGKMTSKPSQYLQRKSGTSSSIATTPIKPHKKWTTKHSSAAQSSTSVSLKKNQTEFSLRRCFCTLRLQKKKRKLRSPKSKKTMSSFSTQHSDKVPKENLLSPADCECDTEMKTPNRKEVKGNRKLTNTEKSPQKSTSSLILEHRSPHTRQEKTQSKKKKKINAYAEGVEVHRPSVNAMTSLSVKSNKSKPTNTEAFWHKCFCTLKFFNKDGSKKHSGAITRPQKKKDDVVKVHSKMTTKHSENIKYFNEPSRLSSFQCEPGICSPDQCNPQECKKNMKANPTRSKNKYSDTSSKNIVLIHENPKLLPYECKPGVCIPDQCNPSECEKLIKQRNIQHKSKYQETNFNTRSTYIEIPKQMISSNIQQSESQTRIKKINKINHYSREPDENIGSGHSNRETVRIGSNFSFNIEFYKERSLGDGIKESDNTTKIVKKQVREKAFNKSEYTRPKSVNVKTKKIQSTTDTKHIASSVEPKTKKRHVYVGSPKKTKCFCTLKLHKKGRNAKNKENSFLTSRSTKTTLELFEPGLNTSVIKSTNTSKILRHELKSYECTPGFCVPNKCDPYICYDNIKKRDVKRHRSRHIATGRELRSVLSNTSSSSNKSRSTQSSNVVEPLQEHRVKKRPDNNDSNYSASRQAVRIGSNFSFNIDFYKDHYNSNTRGKVIPTMFNTVGNLTYSSEIKPESVDYRQLISKHNLLRASDLIKTNDKVPNTGNILKRCFCSLMLQSKDCGRNDYNPCKFNPGNKQFTEVIPGRHHKKSVYKLKSINPLCMTRRKFSEQYKSGHDMHLNDLMPFICHPKSKLSENRAFSNIKRQSGCKANKFSRSLLSSYNDFGKYDENTNNSIPKFPQYSQYQVKKVLHDPEQRNNNPFYNSFYALNLKVSRVRKMTKDLEDDECEPDFCVPYQCDTAECLRRIKSRLKSWKETGTNSTDTRPAASMTDRMRLSHNYVQADKHRTLKAFHPTKKKTRYGSNVKLNMSLYTRLDDTNKQPGKRTPIPQFYDVHGNRTEDEKIRDYDRPAPTRSQQREDLISSKHKSRTMSSLKKYASSKLKSQDKQRDNTIEVDEDGSALVPKSSRKQRKTSNIQTEATVTKSAHIGKEHKSMNIATDRELIDLSKPRKLKKDGEAFDSAAITKLIHSSKFRKAKSFKMESEVEESQKIQDGKSRKSVHIVEPKVIYSGKYKKTVHVPTDPNEIPKSIYRGKYREKISAPTEPEASKSSFSSKYRKLMKIRTDRASRLSRSRHTKMPEELEKFLMKPPRRKVYTIGSNINFSMQFYKEDDSLAVDEEQKAEQTGAASGMFERIRCFCTSKKRDSQDIKSKEESQGGDTVSGEEESVNQSFKEKVSEKSGETESKVSSLKKSRGKGSQKTKKSDLIDAYQKELDEICKFEPEITDKKDDEGINKEKRGSKDIKSKIEGQDGDKELLKEERVSKGSKDIKSKKEKEGGDKASRKEESIKSTKEKGAKKSGETLKVSGMEKSRDEGSQKTKKCEPEVKEKKQEEEHEASDKIDKIKSEVAKGILGIKSICKCKMPVCTCKMPVCKCKMPVCKCKLPECKCKMPECKCKMPECKCKMPECKCKMPECKCKMPECKCKIKGHENENALHSGDLKSRRLRSKSTKVLRKALSVKSDVLNYDKSTLTEGKRFAKSLYECEPHVCIPGICDPNVCFKIFKSQRCVKNIAVSTTQDVKSKLINTPITLTSTPLAASAVKRCFCIFQLKNKQAQNMIDKSLPRIKQETDVQGFKAQNFLRKSFGKVNSLLKKPKPPRQKELVSEKVQLSKQNMDMGPGVPEYAPYDSKLPELSSKKRKRHICKCYKNFKRKKVCECVQEYLDNSKYRQPALPEGIETFPPKPALRSKDKRKRNKMDQNLNLKGDGSKTIAPQTQVKVGRQPICQECRKYTICKCKKRVSHKSVCKCQLQAKDYSTALEPDTPFTDTDKSDEDKLLFKKIKAIPPRLSQSLKSKLAGNIKKKSKPVKKMMKNKQEVAKKPKSPQRKPQINRKNKIVMEHTSSAPCKPDKVKQKINMEIGDDYGVYKNKSKFKGICECPLVNDLEGDTTDTEKVKRRQSIIEAAKRISRSLKSKAPLLGLSLKKQPKKRKKERDKKTQEDEKIQDQVSFPAKKLKPHLICECYPKKSRKPLSPLLALGNLAAGDTKTKKQAVGRQIGQEQTTKAAGDQELKERKKKPDYLKIEQGSAALAVCPCCGKSDYIQSLKSQSPWVTLKSQLKSDKTVCECDKSDTSLPFLKKKSPRGPMIPGLENACALCLRQNLTDVCTCTSKKGKGVHLPSTSFQKVCPECSKKMVIGAKPPQAVTGAKPFQAVTGAKPFQASGHKSYSFEPNIPAILECLKLRKKKDEPPPQPIFNMYVDATNMKLKNKDEIYRNLGIGCKDKLQGSYLPPVEEGQKAKPSIDLVIDRDNASILRPDNMMQPFGVDKGKHNTPKKGTEKPGTSHSVACPICNPLQVGTDASKRSQGGEQNKEHDKHCTCCICTDKDGKRKKGHPKNCTCCICRYGCRFGSTRQPADTTGAESLKFANRSQLLKKSEPETKKEDKKKVEEKKNLSVALKAQNKFRNLSKALQAPKSCYCGLKICDKEIKHMEKDPSAVLEGDIPPPCICGSYICKKRYMQKNKYYRLLEQKRKVEKKQKKERFKRWKTEATARIKEQDAEDADFRKRVLRQDKKAMAALEKYIDDTSSWVLLAENASEIGKFGINTIRRMITSVKRCARHPLDVCYKAQVAREDPKRAAAKALDEFQGSGYSGMKARVSQRCAAMQTSRYLISAMEKNPVTNYLYHFRDRDPKKRLFKRRPEKEPPEVECSPFLKSLRQKPCLWLYHLCPWFYPHCLGFLAFWRQFTDVILFLLAVAVWSPCILLTEFCRSVMCCVMCAGGG